MANGNAYQGIYGGAARGLVAGMRTGLMAREVDIREKESTAIEEQRKMAASMGKISLAFKLLENRNVPSSMKADIWNTTVVPGWNEIYSRPGSQVDGDRLLPTVDEWPDAMNDYIKQGRKIFEDKNLNEEQKLDAMAALQASAGSDVHLAPLMERVKEGRNLREQQDTLRAVELLTSSGGVTPDEAAEWAMIGKRSPKAALEADKLIQQRRKEQREVSKATKLDAFTDDKGNRILVVEEGGKQQKINLGKTKEDARTNAAEWRAAVATRAAGMQSGDPKIDAWTTQQAQSVLAEYNRSDPFKKALADIISGQRGGGPSAAPKNPKEEAEEFFGTFE